MDPPMYGSRPMVIRLCQYGRVGAERRDMGRGGEHAGDGANVDNVALATVGALEEDGHDRLSDVDEAGDVCGEHGVDVLLGDLRGLRNSLDQPAVLYLKSVSCILQPQ